MRRLAGIVVATIAIFGSLGPLVTAASAKPRDKSSVKQHTRRTDAAVNTGEESALIPGLACARPTIVAGVLRRVPR